MFYCRLNYPLKMRKWHHACTSWNGKTGEWQLWIKAERVGRGFHNRVSSIYVRCDSLTHIDTIGIELLQIMGKKLNLELSKDNWNNCIT